MSDNLRFLLFRALFFVIYAPIGVMFPFFVLHLKQDVGLSAREISYVTGVGAITVILFQQLWGYMGDVIVSKKRLVMGNILGSGLLFLWMGELRCFWALIAVFFLFQTLFSSVNQLLHGFLFTHEGGEVRFGALRAYASLGFVTASIAVGWISDHLASGRLMFIFPMFLAVCAASALLLLPIPEPSAVHLDKPPFLAVQAHFLGRRKVRIFLLFLFLYQSAHSLSYIMQSVLLVEMGAEHTIVAFSYSLAALLELPVFFLATRLRLRFGDIPLLLFAAGVQTLRWLAVWQADTPESVILASMAHCITFGLFYAAAVGYMNGHAGQHFKASAQTMMALVYFGFAVLFGNYAGGEILDGGVLQPVVRTAVVEVFGLPDRGNLQNLYFVCSALAALSFFVALYLLRIERHGRMDEARLHNAGCS